MRTMSKTNSGKQIQLRTWINDRLNDIYKETKGKPEHFTEFVNSVIGLYIRRLELTRMRFPHLRVLPVNESEHGLYIMDEKKDEVAIMDTTGLTDLEAEYIVKCKLDDSTSCEHAQFALLSPSLMKFLRPTQRQQQEMDSGSEADKSTGGDVGTNDEGSTNFTPPSNIQTMSPVSSA